MALPNTVFLDTSVFAGQQYNFGSAAFTSFAPVAARHGLVLLLPDPTEREINRQIEERSSEALAALDEARRRAPFLAKWDHFPNPVASGRANWEVRRIAQGELKAFLKQFEVKKLGYEGINVSEVMHWYDNVIPPFREGKKRKEFPDAFALAILAAYSEATGSNIAVVSEDQDFKLACSRYSSLLYFRSLPILTELLLGDSRRIDSLRSRILADSTKLEDAISVAVSELVVIHTNFEYEVDESKISDVRITDLRVVALGAAECTLAFEAEIETEICLVWRESDYVRAEGSVETSWVLENQSISGSAKVSLTHGTDKIDEVTLLKLDQEYFEAERTPDRRV